MKIRAYPRWLIGALALTALFVFSGSSLAVEFTAQIVQADKGDTTTGKFYLKEPWYRMEVEKNGEQFFIIVNQDAGVTWVLMPEEKTYVKMASQDPASLMSDPFQGAKYAADVAEMKFLGIDTLGGDECNKYLFAQQSQHLMNLWVSRTLMFPIRIVDLRTEGTFTELRDIREGPVGEGLFKVPPGYTETTELGDKLIEIPDWAKDVPAAPVVKPPFEQDLVAGKIIRVRVEPGQAIKVSAKDKTAGQSLVVANPFKGGKPTRDAGQYPGFADGGFIFFESSLEADEIVIRVEKGEVRIKVERLKMFEQRVAAGHELKHAVVPGEKIETRFVNTVGVSSKCRVHFYNGDKEVEEGGAGFRTIGLKKKHDYKQKVWVSNKTDRVVIKVEKGEILIKVGQF